MAPYEYKIKYPLNLAIKIHNSMKLKNLLILDKIKKLESLDKFYELGNNSIAIFCRLVTKCSYIFIIIKANRKKIIKR